jgi:hypothetical protein
VGGQMLATEPASALSNPLIIPTQAGMVMTLAVAI